eukprot:6107610-Pyramimonas_sp.AAC.1
MSLLPCGPSAQPRWQLEEEEEEEDEEEEEGEEERARTARHQQEASLELVVQFRQGPAHARAWAERKGAAPPAWPRRSPASSAPRAPGRCTRVRRGRGRRRATDDGGSPRKQKRV